jgi:hypothetical protein
MSNQCNKSREDYRKKCNPTVVFHTKRFETYGVALEEKIHPNHTLQSSLMMKNEKGLFWEKGKNAFLSFKNEQILSAK